MGCNLVISNRGDVKEYFMDDVEYCEPDNVESILEAVNMAWRKEINLKFIDRISMNFTWERAASVTLDVYNNVIKV
jgi:glycosyltransferase involved in cell wall biosynthesis